MSLLCDISKGIKQGGVISPILFTIYIDQLLLRLKCKPFGCHIGHNYCGALGYADDIVLLAPTLTNMDSILEICHKFANGYDVLFNSSKSKLIVFSKKHHIPSIILGSEY